MNDPVESLGSHQRPWESDPLPQGMLRGEQVQLRTQVMFSEL